MESIKKELKDRIAWYNESGLLHREDGPAVEYSNGHKQWWIRGMLHRVDGPAIEKENCIREWWCNDKKHREDGPAVEWEDGTREWWIDGLRHREDGPAIIKPIDTSKSWWIENKRTSFHVADLLDNDDWSIIHIRIR